MNTPEEQFNWKQFVAIISVCCLVTGIAMGVIIYYVTNPTTSAPNQAVGLIEQKDEKIKGNKNSKIYHWPGCPSYDKISEKNIIWFKTRQEAEAAGYRAARNCR